ncbi:bifunctional DNA primase/polymerase [Streptosporangium sp. NPDC001559]|uniref:bifunctional DNA primase/polymerase n=1 Tax=Streptosporangium sp. NPDC001559 TaxID=3366187 RepID=UPI0036ECED08
MTLPSSDRLRYALAAAARGWHVFPLAVHDKPPAKGFTDWEANATTDPGLIRRWWSRTPWNVGIACGPSGLVVVDLDTPKPGKEGLRPPAPWDLPGVTEGADVLALIFERAGEPLPFETFTVRTRRGGTHLYYTAPDGARLGNTEGDKGNGLGWLIDTRGHGGYVVGPGSYVDLPDGTGPYEVLYNAPPAPLPPLMFKQLVPPPRTAPKPVHLALPDTRRGAYLRAVLTRELEQVANAQEGQRNWTLYMAATALGQLVAGGALAESEVTTLLEHEGVGIGLSTGETRLTVASGLKNGARRPRTIAA